MGKARMLVTPELLIQALNLPENTEIIAARIDLFAYSDVVEFIVSHPDIETSEVTPHFLTHYNEDGSIKEVTFEGWHF